MCKLCLSFTSVGNETFTQVKFLCGLISEQFSFPFHSVQFTFKSAPFSSSDIETWWFLTCSLFNALWSFPFVEHVHSREASSHVCWLIMLILDELDIPTYVDYADSWLVEWKFCAISSPIALLHFNYSASDLDSKSNSCKLDWSKILSSEVIATTKLPGSFLFSSIWGVAQESCLF